MTHKRLKHQLFNKEERNFWKNLHVNIDSYCDNWDEYYHEEFQKKLALFAQADIDKVLKALKCKTTQELLEKTKDCILLFCVFEFSYENLKVLSQILDIPIKSGKINKSRVLTNVFFEYKKGKLIDLFLSRLKQKNGKGNFQFSFNSELKKSDFDKINNLIKPLLTHLKKIDKKGSTFYHRFSSLSDEKWMFLLLKQTGDKIFLSIPNNTRLVTGDYIILSIYPQEKRFEVNTLNKVAAYAIRNYLAKKIENRLIYSRSTTKYNPSGFFKKVFEMEESDGKDSKNLELIEVDLRRSNLQAQLLVKDPNRKNNIVAQLKALKEKEVIKLVDFSDFKSLTFYFEKIAFKVSVRENKWGQYRLEVNDKGKPITELYDFRQSFEQTFNIEFDVFLDNEDSSIDEKKIIRQLLNKRIIETNFPKNVEDILLSLISDNIIQKPSSAVKRRCLNRKCRKLTWAKGDCPTCGHEVRIESNHIDIQINKPKALEFLYKRINSSKELSIKKSKKQILGSKFDLLEAIDASGNPLSIFLATNTVPEKLIHHYLETAHPLLVVLTKYKSALANDLISKGFECLDLADFYSNRNTEVNIHKAITETITAQKEKWQNKIVEKGLNSYHILNNKPEGYSDQNFEIDIYNILHELSLVGDRLGGKFAGVPAPDGIISLNTYTKNNQRFCFAWDCKYSIAKGGYQLNDKPLKHRNYIHKLKNNDKVLLFGGLKTYSIISQNMNPKKYEAFYKNLTKGFRWKGNILFIEERHLLEVYEFYKRNSEVVLTNPNSFYNALYRLLNSPWKKDQIPFPKITDERIKSFFKEMVSKYPKNKLDFTFLRSEF